jgi:hypothetical protein
LEAVQPTFIGNLKLALAVYPDAGVEIEEEGLLLLPSRPPVPERQLLRGLQHRLVQRRAL